MLENATNLTIQLEGTVGHRSKTFFSEPYAEPILLTVLIAVTIMIFFVKTKIIGKYRRYQQVFDDLLEPDTVTLGYNKNVRGLCYTPLNDPNLKAFICLITKRIKRHPFKYKARGLYEKVEKVVDDCEQCIEYLDRKKSLVFNDRLKKESCDDIVRWNGEGDKPSDDYIKMKEIPICIENIVVNDSHVEVERIADRRYALKCAVVTIAKTTSKDKIEKVKKSIQSVANDGEIKKLFAKRDTAKRDVVDALELYNNKLAVVINDLRFM